MTTTRCRPTTRPRPTLRQATGAVTRLTASLAVLVGTPVVLAAVFGWPLPRQVPDWGAVADTPAHLIDPHVLVNAMVCAGWVCWAVIAGYLTLEIVDTARGVRSQLVRGGPLATLAAKLVGSAALLLTLARPPAAGATTAPPALAQLLPVTHTAPSAAGPAFDGAPPETKLVRSLDGGAGVGHPRGRTGRHPLGASPTLASAAVSPGARSTTSTGT